MLYKIAEVVFEFTPKFHYSEELMKDYLFDGSTEPVFSHSFSLDELETLSKADGCSLQMAESMEIFRIFSEYLLTERKGFIFHSSAICVGEKAILFCAPSGVGKSTHARMWRETFSDVTMVNDDKPVVILKNGEFFVCGTPWRGKHKLGENVQKKIHAICFIERSENCSAEKIPIKEAVAKIFNQTIRFKSLVQTEILFDMMEKLISSVEIYKLKVNVSKCSALISRNAVLKENYEN